MSRLDGEAVCCSRIVVHREGSVVADTMAKNAMKIQQDMLKT